MDRIPFLFFGRPFSPFSIFFLVEKGERSLMDNNEPSLMDVAPDKQGVKIKRVVLKQKEPFSRSPKFFG